MQRIKNAVVWKRAVMGNIVPRRANSSMLFGAVETYQQ
jgi:hypothetical protein